MSVKRKFEDTDTDITEEFKRCKVTDEIVQILYYSVRSRKWTVLRSSGDTDICIYDEVKNSAVFRDYVYKMLETLQLHKNVTGFASYIT